MTATPLASLPKAVLHEHLDGGLRVRTVAELADEVGYRGLPSDDPDILKSWFYQGDAGSLESYLDAFQHTIAVMQTADAIHRIARENVADLAESGAVYAEIRLGPSLHTENGLAMEDVIEAAVAGAAEAGAEHGVVTGIIVTALRNLPGSVPTGDM